MRRLGVFVATFGYVGYVPVAPGTFGSAAALGLYALVRLADSRLVEAVAILAVVAIGVWSGTEAEAHFAGTDPGPVVIDEVAGMLITLFAVPASMAGVVVAFLLFRIADVVKPFPARRLEDLHGGWGIVLDDCMAGVYANLVLRALVWLWPALAT